MQALKPDVLIPGHGLVIFGPERAAEVLGDGAELLESLAAQTLELMNRGSTLDEILHSVSAPRDRLAKPYLLPGYDDPEFVVRSIWPRYAGWSTAILLISSPGHQPSWRARSRPWLVVPKRWPAAPRRLPRPGGPGCQRT
jgi:alkyl sulfatase BDS1-like metallo-beta-lactamase superfamily hydrolase